ncbi:MFS transporter [Nonomuraea fuscirosea]|uniref:MFS transporter n=1 Tax=Nonomuraea fuscirosea TaxID=1291556 RepID=UPI0034357C52
MNNVYQGRSILKPSVPLAAVLVLACGAQLMVVLDGLIVSVALPDMRTGLDLTPTGQQWVVAGYLVTVGGLLLLAARVADLIGHRRIFIAGLAVFTLASLAGGLAQTGEVLIAARLVQGAGAAALAPSSLSLLTLTHTGEQRARALSLWSATSGSAGALGLVLGGVITSGLGWRWVLLVNVPIGIALWVVAAMTLAPDVARKRRRIDLLGAVSVTVAVGALTYAISRADSGWGSKSVVVALIAAAAFTVLFIVNEQRAAQPLIPLSIFRHRNLVVGNLTIAAIGAVMTATVYFLSLYQQRILDLSPLRTGLALVPMSIVLTVGALASKRLLQKYGAHRLIITGSLNMAIGLAWLAAIPSHSLYLTHVLGATLIWGLGASIVVMPCVALATSDVDPDQAGLASGLVNTARQVGGAIGLAVLASIANTAATHSGTGDPASKIVHGYSIAFITSAAIAVLISLSTLAARTPKTQPPANVTAEPSRSTEA